MRVHVDEIAFTSPAGLEDATSYSFQASSPRAEFDVEFELPAGGATPAAVALADVREQLSFYPQSGFGVDEDGELQLAGQGAPFFRYHIVDDGAAKQGLIAIANLGSEANDGDWVKLSWLLDLPADQVRAHVDPTLASFAKASEPPPAPPPAGAIRHQAGPWAFDLPRAYVGPRSYVWLDELAELRVAITIHRLGVDKPELEQRVDEAQARGRELVDREDVPIIYGDLVRLRLRDELGDEWFVVRVVQGYEFGNPVQIRWVEVGAEGPLTEAGRLRQIVDALLASISVD